MIVTLFILENKLGIKKKREIRIWDPLQWFGEMGERKEKMSYEFWSSVLLSKEMWVPVNCWVHLHKPDHQWFSAMGTKDSCE